ncbi:glycosyltransferase family 4 protein [Neobacillus niacini]|uniref:glycosyltransferase family 4 protein n=1 Tax=Neobacillus niacini TaxID=86668 RepID=UPI00285C5FCE|nr:glycosyltransferase family 4 protein [Neobacillus niacini]MDR6998749.1 1,4-alpha-glucan branching enzyme [Neobacillus niacini]
MDKTKDLPVDMEKISKAHRPLNLLMLSWEYPPHVVGGLSRHVYGLSVHLAELGHEVHVVSLQRDDLLPYEIINGVHVHRVKPLNEQDEDFLSWIGGLNLAMAYKVEKLTDEYHFSLIHAHDWLVGTAAIALKKSLSIPLLATIHATEHGRNNGIHNKMQEFIHRKEQQLITEADQVIVCSEYMVDEVTSIFDTVAEKLAIIPNGVDLLPKRESAVELPQNLHNKKYIFSMGRIVKEKGFETVMEAAEIAKDLKLEYSFVIAGKGPMLETYRKLIKERQLDDMIAFIGFISEQQRNALIQNCEMVVVPSLYEPFGIVALESMALGKPTIVSKTGGLKGIVKHLQTGMLMAPGDAKSLLEQILFLSENPEKAADMAIQGQQVMKSLYSWKRVAMETSRMIEDTLLTKLIDIKER